MKLLALAALLVACKGEPRPAPTAGSGSIAPPAKVIATDPRVTELPGELWFVEDGPPHVMVRLRGGNRFAIEDRLFPSTERLPDGRLIAIRSRGDGSPDSEQLVLVAPDGTPTPLGPAGPQVRDPVAADSSIIAAIQIAGRSELHRIDLASGNATPLTDNKEGNFHPVRLGADAIAFVSSRDGDSELYRMPLAGGAQQRLTAFHKDDWEPVPSPDATAIAFITDREGPPRVSLIAADGTKFRRLTARTAAELEEDSPRWSPDGTRIAYVIRGQGRTQVVMRTVTSGDETILTPAGASDSEPVWSPDGAWIAAVRSVGNWRETQLIAIPVAGGEPVRVSSGPSQLPRWF